MPESLCAICVVSHDAWRRTVVSLGRKTEGRVRIPGAMDEGGMAMAEANEILKAMQERRSVRAYRPDMVPQELIDRVVKAGTYAATGMGRQSPIIIEVTDKGIRDELSKLNAEIMGVDTDPFYGAPVVLIVLAEKSMPTYLYDGSLVMGNLMLAAHALGLGSCWIHRAKEEFERPEGKALLEKLGIEGDYEGIGHCVLGYVDGELPEAKPRKENWSYKIG